MFDVLTSNDRFALIHRVESMKRAERRARTVFEMVGMLAWPLPEREVAPPCW